MKVPTKVSTDRKIYIKVDTINCFLTNIHINFTVTANFTS